MKSPSAVGTKNPVKGRLGPFTGFFLPLARTQAIVNDLHRPQGHTVRPCS
jgi:hypothetical protein